MARRKKELGGNFDNKQVSPKYMQTGGRGHLKRTVSKKKKPDTREHRRTQVSGNDERGGDDEKTLRGKEVHEGAQEGVQYRVRIPRRSPC